jgi:pimeloyl-ACP methyl ester carboxylesterase
VKRALPTLALAATFAATFGLGSFFADPVGLVASAGTLRFRSAGAVSTFVPGPGGARLHTWELGPRSAEVPVLLLHGLGAASHYWTETAIDLARSGRTVIVLDAPGSGRSDPPAPATGWGMPGRVAAVSALLDALRLRKVDLVGHSLGGWTAGAFALAEPHRVRRLVLVDSAGFAKLDPQAERVLRQSLTPRDRAGALRLYDLLFRRKPVPAWGFFVDALGRNYRQENVAATVDALEAKDGLLGRESLLPRGTVFINGDEDGICLLADARMSFARVPEGRLFVVRGAGHDVPLEVPRLFHETLRRALEEPGPG